MTLAQAMVSDEAQQTDGNFQPTVNDAIGGVEPGGLSQTEYDLVSTVPQPDTDQLDASPLWGPVQPNLPGEADVTRPRQRTPESGHSRHESGQRLRRMHVAGLVWTNGRRSRPPIRAENPVGRQTAGTGPWRETFCRTARW